MPSDMCLLLYIWLSLYIWSDLMCNFLCGECKTESKRETEASKNVAILFIL